MQYSKRLQSKVGALLAEVRLLVNWEGRLPDKEHFLFAQCPRLSFSLLRMTAAQRETARRKLRLAWKGGRAAERALTELMRLNEKPRYKYPTRPRWWVNLEARRIDYLPQSALEEACYWVMKRARLIRRCIRGKDCPAPLFVAGRPRTLTCSRECSREAEKKRKREWIRRKRKEKTQRKGKR